MLTRRTLLAVLLVLLASLLPACGGDTGTTGNAGSPAATIPQPTPTDQPASTATPTVVRTPTPPAAAVDATSTTVNASPSVATAGLTDDVVMMQWTSQIVVVNADGSGSRALTDGQTPDGGPVWSPDSGSIAFVSSRDGGGIYVMNPDGTGAHRIADIAAGSLAWSPDGRYIAVGSSHGHAGDYPQIYVVAADGSGSTQLTDASNPPTTTQSMGSGGPIWSPDGSQIAFTVSQLSGASNVYVMNADGTAMRRLTDGGGREYATSWSPDGTLIAFANDAQDADIWVVRPDGSDLRNLTNSPVVEHAHMWAPAGDELLFVRDDLDNHQLVAIAADGTNERVLFESAEYVTEPCWSTDGSRIAFIYGHPEKDTNVFVMNADGSDVRQLTDTPELESSLAWSPDGATIVYTIMVVSEVEK